MEAMRKQNGTAVHVARARRKTDFHSVMMFEGQNGVKREKRDKDWREQCVSGSDISVIWGTSSF